MNAPLTAMFLIAELSGGYSLLLPLMLTSVISYLTGQGMEPYSIYARRLALKGDLLTHNKDKAVLTLMKLNRVVETDFRLVDVDDTLGDLVRVVSKSSRNLFPVVDKRQRLLGIVLLDDIRKIMFNQEMYATTYVRDFMTIPDTVIDINDPIEKVMKKFEESGAWNLPVLQDHKYLGFVSKAKIFNTYRRVLIHFADDE
jgi:CIC family chloride channel protein